MKDKTELLKKLSKEVKQLENILKYRNLYNIRNIVIKSLIKSGIAVDYCLPFILSSIIIYNCHIFSENKPFKIDKVTEKASIETIDTSNGFHLEKLSYDFNYDNKAIQHSTGWAYNDFNLYERTVTSYKIDKQIDLSDTNKFISMSKEDLEKILNINNIETIYKSSLTPEDKLYEKDSIIVTNNFKSEKDSIIRDEKFGEALLNNLVFLGMSTIGGFIIKFCTKPIRKDILKNKLKYYDSSFKLIDKDQLDLIQKRLQIKKENLTMLDSSAHNINEKSPYTLRKF